MIWENLVQLPYKSCKPAYFYSDWAHARVIQAKDLLDQKFDFLKYKDFKTRHNVNRTYNKILDRDWFSAANLSPRASRSSDLKLLARLLPE